MRKILPIVVLLPALLLSVSACAANWVGLGNKNEARIEVDAGSIHSTGNGRLRVWHRDNFSKPMIPDSGAFSFSRLTTLTELQCEQRLASTVQQNYSTADGSELKTEKPDTREFRPVAPDSGLEIILNYACKRRPKPVAAVAPPVAPTPPPLPAITEKEAPKKAKNGKKAQDEPPPAPPHWSYAGNTGADKWGSLGADYTTCSLGQRQSPIDIRRTIRADLPPIRFAYKAVPLAIADTGHSIQVDTPDAGSITVDGEDYELRQLHFHKPGEEKRHGKAYDMSVHFVHQSKTGKLAVVAVMLEAGKEQDLIRTLWTHLPLERNKLLARADVKIDPTLLLPPKRNYITYLGSLTTPPCTEDVIWLVLKTPVQISKEQLAGFATIYKNNARPIQPVNDRVIKESR